MTRLGLYLAVGPHAGGMFQYSLSILTAVASLPPGEFDVGILYEDSSWLPYVNACALRGTQVAGATTSAALSRALLGLGFSPGACRRLSPLLIPSVRAMLRERRALWIFPAQDLLAYQAPVAALVSVHDLMHRYEPQFPEVSAAGRYRLRERRFRGIAATARGILVDSQTGKRQVVESFRVEPQRVHPLPYVPPVYLSKRAVEPGVERYGLPVKFAFYPAQFWPHKNHRLLLEALAILKPRLPDVHLALSGARTLEYDALVRRSRELGIETNVTFLGRVADAEMPELYRRARCLVMPTFFGPTNIPPLEAFALGCPVAVSSVYGMPEQVGDAALTFDPRSVADIAEALSRLWTDDALCAELRERGSRRAAEWDQAAFNRRFREIVERVLR